jgi:hypothetical protein
MASSGGVSKLELAKEATLRSMDMLFPTDRIGVIAFDDSASWVVPITELDDPDPVASAIGSIRPGGGTDILAGLQAMAQVLPEDPAALKHVILLTDGGADPAGIPELVTELYTEHNITLTTIGVGADAAAFLPTLAELGGGRYHFASDPAAVPTIFTEETTLATRAYIEEHEFTPVQTSGSPILAGITGTPPLLGYVAAAPKDFAQQILVTDLGDPLLSAWQYGLGRAVAFTSDATGRWAQMWLDWEGFSVFWPQTIAYTMGSRLETPLEVRVEQVGGSARLVVMAQTESGETLNGYTMLARVVDPRGRVESLTLEQTAPGRYEGEFTTSGEGAYSIGAAGQPPASDAEGAPTLQAAAGWVMAYSPEYLHLEADPQQLCSLAENAELCLAAHASEGWAVPPAEVFARTLPASRAVRPVWPWLVGLAALLLPVDIAIRRLVITTAEMRRGVLRLVQAGRARVRRLLKRPASEPHSQERIQALFQAKQRAARPEEMEPYPPTPPRPPAEAAAQEEHQPASKEQPPAPSDRSGKTASSLLESKRQRKKNRD